jgi:hypothetical protein
MLQWPAFSATYGNFGDLGRDYNFSNHPNVANVIFR